MLEDMAGMGAGSWRRARAALRGTFAPVVDRLRHRSRLAVRRATRLTVPAVLAYVLAHQLFPHAQPLTGPLTALLVVQVSLFATLTTGLERVLAVVSGVVLAVVVSSVVDLTWWSLGAVVALAIVVGHLLRLGDHLLEVPISALLVLGVSSAESAATSRIAETLVGAGVGVAFTVLFPPPVQTRTAGEAVETAASCTGEVLDRVADELPHASRERAGDWLEDVRRLSQHIVRADRALEEAGDSRRLNPRAVGTTDALPLLRRDLDALEHTAVALRQLFRTVNDGVRARAAQPAYRGRGSASVDLEATALMAYDAEVRSAFAALLRDLAQAMRAFGALARAEAESGQEAAKDRLAAALYALTEARALLTELLLVDPREDRDHWELHGSLLAAVGRVLGELDIAERDQRRDKWLRELPRSRTSERVGRLRETSRQVVEVPRQLRRR
jgi:Fusaric acid resistance protein-like